jgi:hypothetical protein
MAVLSIATVGWEGCLAWARTLGFEAQVASGSGEAWHRAKYVDMAAFFHLLLGGHATAAAIVMMIVGVAALGVLGRAWWRSDGLAEGLACRELWAATLCFALVVNAYAPIYDTVLAVAAIALVASKREQRPEQHREAFAAWLLLLYMVPWLTQSFAEFLHLQLMTVVLAGFGVWALRLPNESTGKSGTLRLTYCKSEGEESTMPHQLQPGAAG